jgi:DNA-binding transcriptional regulator GbsR (MarR family)
MVDVTRGEEKAFVEEVSIVFEQTGLPRMAGRVFGYLLISDPPYQSPEEITRFLMASRGSISTTIRLLVQLGFIERYLIPGERHDHFRLSKDALLRTIQHGLSDEIRMYREMAQRGLALMKDESPDRRRRLEEMRDRYSFLEKALPAAMERYEKKQEKIQVKSLIKNNGHKIMAGVR